MTEITISELMLSIRDNTTVFYHRDTKTFDYCPVSEIQMKHLNPNKKIPLKDENNFRLPSAGEIDHNGLMRFFVKENVEDKKIRRLLFGILSRHDYMDDFLDMIRELGLYDDFLDVCGDIYEQIFQEWMQKNGLTADEWKK